MPTYEQRTPSVEAEQWDGTIQGARKILALLPEGYKFITIITRIDPDDWSSRLEFDFPSCNHKQMRSQDWLVKHFPAGMYEVVDDQLFQQFYDVPSQAPAS